MASYKETPRQKMISMMYLVLIAMLALNVSKQMLDAFIVVNESMEDANQNFASKIKDVYTEFNKQYNLNPNKVGEFHEQALQVQEQAENLIAFIDSIKYALVITTEDGIRTVEEAQATPLAELHAKDYYTEPTRFFFQRSTTGENALSGELRRRIDNYRSEMLQFIEVDPESDRLGLMTKGPFQNADGKKQTWMQHNFFQTILAADITILNKLIGDVQSAEFDVVSYLFSSVTAEDYKFGDISAKVISNNSYILQGQKYEAEILVAAFDTKQNPEVYVLQGVDAITESNIDRARQIEGKDGIVKLNFNATREGVYKYAGIVRVKNPIGESIDYPFRSEYIVAPPSLTVAATKMNVFYIGVDNPISISVPGMADENIRPSITEGQLKKDPNGNGWIANVDIGTTSTVINAQANYEGSLINIGRQEFRVKRVPDPVAQVAGIISGSIDKNTLLAANAIIPVMKDFQFDLNFIVNSFTMATIINGDWVPKNTRGNRFSQEMANLIRSSKRGQKFFFENIQAVGPDGVTRTLNPISLTIK